MHFIGQRFLKNDGISGFNTNLYTTVVITRKYVLFIFHCISTLNRIIPVNFLMIQLWSEKLRM